MKFIRNGFGVFFWYLGLCSLKSAMRVVCGKDHGFETDAQSEHKFVITLTK